MTRLPQLKRPLGKLRRFGLLGGLLVLFTALFAGEQAPAPARNPDLQQLERSSPDETARRARSLWTATKYDWTRVAKQTLEVYKQVCNDISARR